MVKINVQENESFEEILRRFNKAVNASGHMREIREKRFYLPPTFIRRGKKWRKRLKSYLNTVGVYLDR